MSHLNQIIKKADAVVADLAAGGRLNPQQRDRFLRKLIDQPTLLKQARSVVMTSPEMKINKIGIGSRVLRAATEGVALTQGERSKPVFGSITLNSKELIAEMRIPYQMLEDNIEGGNVAVDPQSGAGGLHGVILDLLAEQAALDLEELALLGDTASGDTYLAQHDGYLKRLTTNVVNVGGAFDKNAAKAAVKTLPTKYLRNRTKMRHFVAVDAETDMRDSYSGRPTSLGDNMVQGLAPLQVFGSNVEAVALMPSANGIFTDPQNLIWGIHRDLMLEFDKNIQTREFIIVLTTRVALQIEEEDASLKYVGITA